VFASEVVLREAFDGFVGGAAPEKWPYVLPSPINLFRDCPS
jgi:hypothetical protein